MSDFLTNLAARAIAQPSLRPRTRSRFEPLEETPAPLEWPTVAMERRPPAGRPAGSPAGVVETNAVKAEQATATGQRPVHPPASGRRAPEVRIEREVAREIEHDVQRVVETQERIVRVPQVERIQQIERPHRYEQQPPRILREREELHRERLVRERVDRRPQILTQPQSAQAAPAQEKTIHVSIGRVEVRAVSQPQPQRERPRGAAMSIDDYVARRKAKERR